VQLKKVSSDTKIEETVLMGMTVSTPFLSKIRSVISESFFTSSYAQTVCEWILGYFDKNLKAPMGTLEKIFESKKDSLGREDIMVIVKLLERMSDIYSDLEDVDDDFLFQTAMPFIEKRELELKMDKAAGLISQGEFKEAREILETPPKTVAFEDVPESPVNDELVEKVLFSEHNYVFEYGGALGNVIGPLKKKWTIIFQAPMKRGKTQM